MEDRLEWDRPTLFLLPAPHLQGESCVGAQVFLAMRSSPPTPEVREPTKRGEESALGSCQPVRFSRSLVCRGCGLRVGFQLPPTPRRGVYGCPPVRPLILMCLESLALGSLCVTSAGCPPFVPEGSSWAGCRLTAMAGPSMAELEPDLPAFQLGSPLSSEVGGLYGLSPFILRDPRVGESNM